MASGGAAIGCSMLEVGGWMFGLRALLQYFAGRAGKRRLLCRPVECCSTNGTDFASFQIIGQRNIFDPNRVPHRRSSSSAARVVDSFSFVGTMSYAKGNFAFFDGTSPDFRKVLELEGSIADFKVTAITPKSVTLVSGTNETVLPLGTQMRRDDDGHWVVSSRNGILCQHGQFVCLRFEAPFFRPRALWQFSNRFHGHD